MVSMISAIGGTMGLCIGFSFTDFTSKLLKVAEQAMGVVNSDTNPDNILFTKTETTKFKVEPDPEENFKLIAKLEKRIQILEKKY